LPSHPANAGRGRYHPVSRNLTRPSGMNAFINRL
jgi:hypothetical protein